MTINRVPEVPYAQIANAMLRDRRLSFRARGILAMVLSNVGEWEATRDYLEDMTEKEGREAIQTALNELTDLGYRTVSKVNGAGGMIVTIVDWHHEPTEGLESRPPVDPSAGSPDGRETRPPIEAHSSEDQLSEDHSIASEVVEPTEGERHSERLANLLADLILANGAKKRPEVGKRWLDAIRLMIDRDGIAASDVEGAIRWSQSDSFWRGNVLSADKLREKYDTLRLHAARSSKPSVVDAGRAVHEQLLRERDARGAAPSPLALT